MEFHPEEKQKHRIDHEHVGHYKKELFPDVDKIPLEMDAEDGQNQPDENGDQHLYGRLEEEINQNPQAAQKEAEHINPQDHFSVLHSQAGDSPGRIIVIPHVYFSSLPQANQSDKGDIEYGIAQYKNRD